MDVTGTSSYESFQFDRFFSVCFTPINSDKIIILCSLPNRGIKFITGRNKNEKYLSSNL